MEKNEIAFVDYLQLEKKYSVHTVNAYKKDLAVFSEFVKSNFDQEHLKEVNYSQIRSWIVTLIDTNISPASVNRKMASLKAFYKFLLKTKQIDASPFVKHRSLKTGKKMQIPFSEKEMETVLGAGEFASNFEGKRNKLIIDLIYTTGIRRAELIELKLVNIDLAGKTIRVLGKRNKERVIPILSKISDQMQVYIKERTDLEVIQDKEYFFLTERGNKLNISLVYRLVNGYFSGATEKVKKSPHILRHSFATHLLNNGADINSVKDLLGHATLASTQVYTHNSLAELKKTHAAAHPRRKKDV